MNLNLQYKNKGFTYIEILISLFIFSLLLLTTMATALNSLKATEQSYLQSVATVQMIAILERLRANHSLAARLQECQQWQQQLQSLLPQAKGECFCQPTICKVHLNWQDQQLIFTAQLA